MKPLAQFFRELCPRACVNSFLLANPPQLTITLGSALAPPYVGLSGVKGISSKVTKVQRLEVKTLPCLENPQRTKEARAEQPMFVIVSFHVLPFHPPL